MKFNYSKLKGRIIEMFETHYAFAAAMGISKRTLSMKLSNQISFKQSEIIKACELLEISVSKINLYFFSCEVQNIELK